MNDKELLYTLNTKIKNVNMNTGYKLKLVEEINLGEVLINGASANILSGCTLTCAVDFNTGHSTICANVINNMVFDDGDEDYASDLISSTIRSIMENGEINELPIIFVSNSNIIYSLSRHLDELGFNRMEYVYIYILHPPKNYFKIILKSMYDAYKALKEGLLK